MSGAWIFLLLDRSVRSLKVLERQQSCSAVYATLLSAEFQMLLTHVIAEPSISLHVHDLSSVVLELD